MNKNNLKVHYIALAAGLLSVLVYLRAIYCGFSPMDDHLYVFENTFIQKLDSNLLYGAFLKAPFDLWQPLTWLSLAIDYRFWQLNPMGYHLTNILLHAVNVGLVVLIADRILGGFYPPEDERFQNPVTYPIALLLAGLLFGIHPLRVESVAWIAERKDVLNGVFSLGSILFYLRYAEKRSSVDYGGATRNYLLSWMLFVLSLMTKPVSVTLPAMLMVVDWYPLRRFRYGRVRSLLVEKIPYIIPSVMLIVATFYFASQNHILRSLDDLSFSERVIVAGNGIFDYCRLIIFPVGISPLHLISFPLPPHYVIKAVIVAGVFTGIYAFRRHEWLPATWLCFVIPLIPVLGFFQNGEQAIASRYTYLPSVAPTIAAAVLVAIWCREFSREGRRKLVYGLGSLLGIYLLFFAGMSVHLIRFWDNAESLWSRVVDLQPTAKSFFTRGELYSKMGKYDAAVKDYTAVIDNASGELKKYVYNVYAYRGMALLKTGFLKEAVRDFTTAISMSPHAVYYYNRGLAYRELGDYEKAGDDFKVAGGEAKSIEFWYYDPSFSDVAEILARKPADADAYSNRAHLFIRAGNYEKALQDITAAISLQPARDDFYGTRSRVYFETGRFESALENISIALQINSKYLDGYLRRASIYFKKNEYVKALNDLDQVVRIDSHNFEGYANRGLTYYQLGRPDKAIEDFDEALWIKADSASIYYNRGLAYAAKGDNKGAEEDFLRARRLGYSAGAE